MNTTVRAEHLRRKAVIYIRQSTPSQVLSHQESLRLQYALRRRALDLGWREDDIEVIDADLGLSGAAATHRAGFKDLLARVTLGEVGLILAYEVTRLCRNCSDWYPLLDICGYRDCLIADTDGIYDPATPNGRLLLGLKGQISELELHTLRTRLTAGLLSKAERGELALVLPVGLVRDEAGIVRKDPDAEVCSRLELIFTTFLRLRSAAKTLRFFNEHELKIPRRDRFGELLWKRPTVAALLSTLKNPAYAGAFCYGRTRTLRTERGSTQKKLPVEQWRVLLKDKYPAYIDWASFEKIQAMLQDNYAEYDRNKTRGLPREGAALLHGLVYCGACGHKMVVQYKTGTRYLCNYLRQQHGVPVCQYIPADPVDRRVVEAFFEALSPIELDAYARAVEAEQQQEAVLEQAHGQQLDRLRYQVALARRQYDHVDPENRLVASELERRWEEALRQLKEAEEAYQSRLQVAFTPAIPHELAEAFRHLGQRLPEIWDTGLLSTTAKKAFLRCLIEKVVVHRSRRDELSVRIVWRGGAVTALVIPIAVGSFEELSFAREMEQSILTLSQSGYGDEQIAEELTRRGYRSPLHEEVLPSTVKGIRLKHGLFRKRSQSHRRHFAGYLTVPELAVRLGVERHWLYDRIHNGRIAIEKDARSGCYLFPDKPETLAQLRALEQGQLDRIAFLSREEAVGRSELLDAITPLDS